ncbi:L-asparaginase [hydrothermal vent metagenome]|uniref:L-asparaginase n=1 Tax=hydrothermal vent metagenome TaxID=652676 RepID=A0A1W1DLX4_9ZZZZ
MTIKLLITGGTIDKVYNKLSGELEFSESHLEQMLERGRVSLDTSPEILFLKDSLDMNGEDRNLILSKCLECNEDNIVITHGTDTMVETAKLLGNKIQDKTIVLFGAMIPYSIDNSDALFNLGVALNAAQTKDSGVYVAMNGQVFDFDKVEKNKSLGIFTNT